LVGQIIIVSGTSGSGKSTTCQLLARRSEEFWLLYGIDHFLSATFPAKFGHHGARSTEGICARPVDEDVPDGPLRWYFSDWGIRAFQTFHEWLAAASRQGCNIIVDHLLMTDPPLLQDCVRRLQGLPVLFVSLKPPYEVLMERVATRTMEPGAPGSQYTAPGMAERVRERLDRLRPWFYQAVYANDLHDLEIDSDRLGPEAVCEAIERRLAEGPGTAFGRLLTRYGVDPGRLTAWPE
jgi:chloramphenicol 3-O-phosphotransferase